VTFNGAGDPKLFGVKLYYNGNSAVQKIGYNVFIFPRKTQKTRKSVDVLSQKELLQKNFVLSVPSVDFF
jgi:hypothetical protein